MRKSEVTAAAAEVQFALEELETAEAIYAGQDVGLTTDLSMVRQYVRNATTCLLRAQKRLGGPFWQRTIDNPSKV